MVDFLVVHGELDEDDIRKVDNDCKLMPSKIEASSMLLTHPYCRRCSLPVHMYVFFS